ncbi:hypothetical protein A0J61_06288 [Choanephora cucurbitarum]|uniref:Uncharacterized protein n=1 Tax=Choanephora cucurbitarum TaxID=101091 RepID=A0A1C7N949_9FUNG|nr:hypothetical protein A0J61_06288 [Choanephora cucurbitarum]
MANLLHRCLVKLEDLLKRQSSHTIIADDFSSDFDDDQNSLTDAFSRWLEDPDSSAILQLFLLVSNF